ncbi:Fur-regulated basic protein B [Melghiribacillus thermohalophilus]|uniref:Fur-regulated basic protein B n=1 Tax=Melghiribacillus thermohalophilus TaxID=1324956 RepID=A0A4R3MTA6_9BACI|nr:FbpB family small basic protein [Melghiribacillus thermohalophilus]TCT18066.1 Fur-regulated basic protein B [Melghiribacillus thermohalophilus]
MRPRRPAFEELVNEYKTQLMQDEKEMVKIEKRIEHKQLKRQKTSKH